MPGDDKVLPTPACSHSCYGYYCYFNQRPTHKEGSNGKQSQGKAVKFHIPRLAPRSWLLTAVNKNGIVSISETVFCCGEPSRPAATRSHGEKAPSHSNRHKKGCFFSFAPTTVSTFYSLHFTSHEFPTSASLGAWQPSQQGSLHFAKIYCHSKCKPQEHLMPCILLQFKRLWEESLRSGRCRTQTATLTGGTAVGLAAPPTWAKNTETELTVRPRRFESNLPSSSR